MTVVKSVELKKDLKTILEKIRKEDVFLDYYGDLFRIEPVENQNFKVNPVMERFKNRKRSNFADNSIFDEKTQLKKMKILEIIYMERKLKKVF